MTIHKTLFIALCIGLFAVGAGTVFAAEYVSLVKLPGFEGTDALSISDFINTTYQIVVALGAMAGVIKIAIAGVKYSMSDVITDKSEAKKDILGVLLGLAILLMPWIILNTIYPNLLNLDFSERMQSVQVVGDGTGSKKTKRVSFYEKICPRQSSGESNEIGGSVDPFDGCEESCKNGAEQAAEDAGLSVTIRYDFEEKDCSNIICDKLVCTAYYEEISYGTGEETGGGGCSVLGQWYEPGGDGSCYSSNDICVFNRVHPSTASCEQSN